MKFSLLDVFACTCFFLLFIYKFIVNCFGKWVESVALSLLNSNFGKAILFRDMDFKLDDDFGKISSFNVDMSDLDVSSPVKKTGKPSGKSKEVSAEKKTQGKSDRSTFQFDFDGYVYILSACDIASAKLHRILLFL